MDVLILAGGREKTYSQEMVADAAYSIKGRTMLDHVVDALTATNHFNRIIVVGLEEALRTELRSSIDCFINPGASIEENLRIGLLALNPDQLALVVAADIPLLNPDGINEFIEHSDLSIDLNYPVIPQEVYVGSESSMHRTSLRLRDGIFTGGNMMLLKPKVILEHMDLVRQVLQYRKNPISWAKLLGWDFFIRALTAGISLADVEQRVLQRFGIKGRAVCCRSLGIGLDADTEEDLGWIRFYWGVEKEPAQTEEIHRIKQILAELQHSLETGEIKKARIVIDLQPKVPHNIQVETE
jgi:GTP:adenosylcobinamide-phosphate guanylyltransferase